MKKSLGSLEPQFPHLQKQKGRRQADKARIRALLQAQFPRLLYARFFMSTAREVGDDPKDGELASPRA